MLQIGDIKRHTADHMMLGESFMGILFIYHTHKF